MILIVHAVIAIAVVFVVSLVAAKLMSGSVKPAAITPLSVVIGGVAYFVFMQLVANQSSESLMPILMVSVVATAAVGLLRKFVGARAGNG